MERYIAAGKQVIYQYGDERGSVHIADAGDNEKADLLATTLNERSPNFIRDALRTCSPNWHGDKVAKHYFIETVNEAIKIANKLDKIKKTLFYGKDNNLISEGQTNLKNFPDYIAGMYNVDVERIVIIDLIHGILGKFTEAGELLEALKEAYNGNGLDLVNINEEIGDGFWYDAILLNRTDSTFEEVQQRIIRKLRARYPDKFADELAVSRNLTAERAILEDKANPLVEELAGPEQLDYTGETLPVGEIRDWPDAPLPGIDDVSGDNPEYSGLAIDPAKPLIGPSKPASGKEAVEAAAASATQAFANVGTVKPSVPSPVFSDPELAKPISERLTPMPQEKTAQEGSEKISL